MSPEEAAVHAYLCADGYVIKNPRRQKHKYYRVGFRNTNKTLLMDFQIRFQNVYGIRPTKGVDRMEVWSKEIVVSLLSKESFYSREWKMPSIRRRNTRFWLRAFFDCEAWVELQPYKSRAIRVDSANPTGLKRIREQLSMLGITTQITERKNRDIKRLNICGKENLKRYNSLIGFLHPDKKALLEKAVSSYKTYKWKIPKTRQELLKFVKARGRKSDKRKQVRFNSIIRKNLVELQQAFKSIEVNSKLSKPLKSGTGSIYYCLSVPYSSLKEIQ